MSRPKNTAEYREQLAEMFVDLLEQKGLSWKSGMSSFKFTDHHNAITKYNYKGSNIFVLSFTALKKGYDDVRWVTMNQIMDKQNKYHPNEKWHLKKGTKATYVEYWYPYDKENKKAVEWSEFEKNKSIYEDRYILRTKYTAVFNASCVEGMPELEMETRNEINIDEVVEKLSRNMNVPINYIKFGTPHYRPTQDAIYMPYKELFQTDYDFNSTVLHELAHSTGHKSRLNRDMLNTFGNEEYAYEELVAEISACFMSVELKDEQTEENINNHKAYVKSWIRALKNNPEYLTKAIKDAEKCANYMDEMLEMTEVQDLVEENELAIENELVTENEEMEMSM